MSQRLLRSLAIAAAVAGVIVYALWGRPEPAQPRAGLSDPGEAFVQSRRPDRPPEPGRDSPRRVPQPELPPRLPEIHRTSYTEAIQAGAQQPGEQAFRATVDAFVEHNKSFAEAQARAEGLSMDEMRELTYFGFLVMQTQRWSEIEELVGHELGEDERMAADTLMHEINSEFKSQMRKLVADQASTDDRWALIRSTQERYLTEYYAITGMNTGLLDDLLAGDVTRAYAPIATPPPAHIPEGPAHTPPEPRPAHN